MTQRRTSRCRRLIPAAVLFVGVGLSYPLSSSEHFPQSGGPGAGTAWPAAAGADEARARLERGDSDGAATLARRRLADERSSDESSSAAGLWADLLIEAIERGAVARADEIRSLTATAIEVHERVAGPSSGDLAASLGRAGSVLAEIDSRRAQELLERAMAILEAVPERDEVAIARICHRRARVEFAREEPWLALPWANRANEIFDRRLGPHHRETHESWLLTTLLQVALFDCSNARLALDRAEATFEALSQPMPGQEAELLRERVAYEASCGKHELLRMMAEQALALDETAFGPDHPRIAQDLVILNESLSPVARTELREPPLLRARRILEAAYGLEDPRLVAVLSPLALELANLLPSQSVALYDVLTRLAESAHGTDNLKLINLRGAGAAWNMALNPVRARDTMARVVSALESRRGVPPPQLAGALTGYGMAHVYLNDYRSAVPILDRALALWDAFSPNDPRGWNTVFSVAETADDNGDFEKSESLYRRLVRTTEKAYGREWPPLNGILQSFARLYIRDQQPASAKPLVARALKLAERQTGPTSGDTAWCLLRDCELKNALGDNAGALAACRRALGILERLDPSHMDLISLRALLARVYMATGDAASALHHALQAEAGARQFFLSLCETLPEKEALAVVSAWWKPYGVSLSILGSTKVTKRSAETISKVWNSIILSRALVLDEMALRVRYLSNARTSRGSDLVERLVRARSELSRMHVRNSSLDGRDFAAALFEADRQLLDAEREVAKLSVELRRGSAERTLGLDEVRNALPDRTALVAFATFDNLTEPQVPRRDYLAFVLGTDRTKPQVVTLGAAAEIDAFVARWRKEISSPPPFLAADSARAERSYQAASARLRERVWDPIAPWLGDTDAVLIVPEGSLNLVNFGTLRGAGGSYLVEGHNTYHVISAERDVVNLAVSTARGFGLLALGGPDFDRAEDALAPVATARPGAPVRSIRADTRFRGQAPDCERFRSMRFEPLPRTLVEVEQVSDAWNKQPSDTLAGDVIRLTDAGASEAVLKQLAPGRRILHLATHGVYLEASCSAAMESPSARPTPKVEQAHGVFRSFAALALAGANHRDRVAPDQEDGILTTEEIASLDLTGVEWAVLSACDSGTGMVHPGEGVFGLRRAFHVAGAKTLISSLWKVRDEDTQVWMSALYRARAGGGSTSNSVRDASREVLEARRRNGLDTHPFHWGAFIASGGWL